MYGNVLPFRRRVAAAFRASALGQIMLQPRLAMTAAMAFFSIALTMNLMGIHRMDLRASDLAPSSLKRDFYSANASVVHYYEGLRVVYELESRVHDLESAQDNDAPAAWQSATLRPIRVPARRASPGGATRSDAATRPAKRPAAAARQQSAGAASKPAPDPGTSRREEFQPSRRLMLASGGDGDTRAYCFCTGRKDTGMNCANHPDRERAAFCQNCGKPLCTECVRNVGTSVFCEPCLAARVAGTAPPAGYPYSGYPPGRPPATGYPPGQLPPPPAPGEPNPGLAALLGFIPGVGAMYNEQYAKGIVHLMVFAVLVSLASDVNDIFGLFVIGLDVLHGDRGAPYRARAPRRHTAAQSIRAERPLRAARLRQGMA